MDGSNKGTKQKLTCGKWGIFAALLLALIVVISTNGTPIWWRFQFLAPHQRTLMWSCQSNVRQLSYGLNLYSQDYSGRFPPAFIGGVRPTSAARQWSMKPPVGWVDALFPYTLSSTLNYCPNTQGPYNGPPSHDATYYWFNRNLSAFPSSRVVRPIATLLLGDGNDGLDGADGTYSKNALPPQWINDYSSPCYRHLGGANYSFVDGHVKWLKPPQISSAPGAAYTFSTR